MSNEDVGYLRQQLLNAQKLNAELHRRLQSCEGADTKLEGMKEKMRKQTKEYITLYRDEREYFRKEFGKLRRQVDSLPSLIKWLFKL